MNHSFHIPVMGTSYTVDTPIKVAHYGISSVISLTDDFLIEKIRKYYCDKFGFDYEPIDVNQKDSRAKRITAYLNIVKKIVDQNIENIKTSIDQKTDEIDKFISLLPNKDKIENIKTWINDKSFMGKIDVNIMTKLDKETYFKGEKMSNIYNDAHSALRGFANSDLESGLVLSAGMNPRLYSYIEEFKDFYPNENGEFKKIIILKVSDYRSSLIQGKFLAKKGIWVSEYRLESGLNCGGHAFATDGLLMGPILEEFKKNKQTLIDEVYDIYINALKAKDKPTPKKEALNLSITTQGGVGTAEEHNFLLEKYNVDSIGWGSPFLLVPEVIAIDDKTVDLLANAKEDDFYLSDVSPLGVPFNNVKGASKDVQMRKIAMEGKPGSPCPKKFLVFNKDYSEKAICVASRKYENIKVKELDEKNLSKEDYKQEFEKIIVKACLCLGLGKAAVLKYGLDDKGEGEGVSVCPGPNTAWFSKKFSLTEMVGHIYGRADIIDKNRPNMFVKELNMYMDFITKKIKTFETPISKKDQRYVTKFVNNMISGVDYYINIFSKTKPSEVINFEKAKEKLKKIII